MRETIKECEYYFNGALRYSTYSKLHKGDVFAMSKNPEGQFGPGYFIFIKIKNGVRQISFTEVLWEVGHFPIIGRELINPDGWILQNKDKIILLDQDLQEKWRKYYLTAYFTQKFTGGKL